MILHNYLNTNEMLKKLRGLSAERKKEILEKFDEARSLIMEIIILKELGENTKEKLQKLIVQEKLDLFAFGVRNVPNFLQIYSGYLELLTKKFLQEVENS